MIPEDVKNKIQNYSECFIASGVAKSSAEFGYSLAQQELAEKDKETERLKGLIEKAWHQAEDNVYIERGEYDRWEGIEQSVYKHLRQFKSENNL